MTLGNAFDRACNLSRAKAPVQQTTGVVPNGILSGFGTTDLQTRHLGRLRFLGTVFLQPCDGYGVC
jgi:hypothetical protein